MAKTDSKRKVFALTGIRSEYDLQYSVSKYLNENSNIDFRFIVFGAHLSEKFGYTVKNIEEDKFEIVERINTPADDDSYYGKTKTAAILLNALSELFEREKPDLIIVTGDREEVITASIAATYFNIPICHLFGGDKTFPDALGNVDEQIRNATTKLAHLHFVIHDDHKQRVTKMGEEPWRVYNIGSPALDKYNLFQFPSLDQLSEYFKRTVSKSSYAVLIHHPLPNNLDESVLEIKNILEILAKRNIHTFVSYPNNDPGNKLVIECINEYAERFSNFTVYKNLPREFFIPLISNASFLIGNSSMGILECPYLEIPAINVGKRQRERLNAGNVIFTGYDIDEIEGAVETVTQNLKFISALKSAKFFYGDGYSGKKIAELIATVPINKELLAKRITY